MCGQENLNRILKRASHSDLAHRITLQFIMHPISNQKTAAYIDYRITRAGGSSKIFEPESKDLIHDYIGGVPWQIKNLFLLHLHLKKYIFPFPSYLYFSVANENKTRNV